jgi:hypothetical protein
MQLAPHAFAEPWGIRDLLRELGYPQKSASFCLGVLAGAAVAGAFDSADIPVGRSFKEYEQGIAQGIHRFQKMRTSVASWHPYVQN